MPMTFPAHQGLILPVTQRWPNAFDALALSIGAAMPDITDSILGFLLNGYFKQWYGHALLGIFTLDLAGGLLITWLVSVFAAVYLKYTRPPQVSQPFFAKARLNRDSAPASRWASRLGLWSFSLTVGTLSHIGFDLISHDTNLLLYPWVENARWLPEWWYVAWFEIRPLPVFGHSYSVGVFTVLWCVLTLIGIFSFFRFLGSKHATKL